MSTQRAIGYALLVLLVVGLVVAGGYLVYQLGYQQGVQASAMGPMMERFESFGPHRFSPWHRPGLRGGFAPGTRLGRVGFGFPIVGLGLGGLGVVALVVTVAILLLVRDRDSQASGQDSSEEPGD